MKLAKTLVPFVLAILIAYIAIGNSIPQIESKPVEIATEIGESPEELVAAGKKIFESDRATCLMCHSLGEDPKARCPNQEGLGERAATRKAGYSAGQYLIESVYNPNAFIVPGYPKNQMTPVNKPPITLSHDEILAVVSFLNTLGGVTDEVFVQDARSAQEPWRKGLLTAQTDVHEDRLPILPGDADRGSELFQTIGCVQCHTVLQDGGAVGPELTAIGASQGGAYILESIIQPYEVIVKGYKRVIITWNDDSRLDLYGVPVEWIPNKDQPLQVLMSVAAADASEPGGDFFGEEEEDFFGADDAQGAAEEDTAEAKIAGADRVERLVELSEVAYIGDSIVAVETEKEFIRYVGDYIEGDEENGVVLSLLEKGHWVEKRIPPENISFVTYPASPMPEDFAETMSPRETYDLVAYLLDQKGKS